MAKHKKTLFDKLVKRDYNNYLEKILSKKKYQEETKNLLLDILYKIENSYKDYETVKKNVISKEEYIENIINIVKNDCDTINFIMPKKNQKKKFEVDKEKKQILCSPIGEELLYCLSEIKKCDDIVKQEPEILNKSLTDMINIGNNINTVEPLRDFNGFSWNISALDIENFYYNIIYQDLVILAGNKVIDEWSNKHSEIIDYVDLLKDYMEKMYGRKVLNEVIEILKTISILLELSINNSFKDELKQRQKYINSELEAMENKIAYLENQSNRKKELTNKIREIDIILNDKKKLAEEYKNRNKDLPLEKKIFSKRILQNSMEEERENLMQELQQCTYNMESRNFLLKQKSLKYELEYVNLIDKKEIKKQIIEKIVLLQKKVLQSLQSKIKNAKDRDTLLKIWYEIRYWGLIPLDARISLGQIPRLKKLFKQVKEEAIKKAYELKIINKICKNENLNLEILENIFSLYVIKLEDINAKILIQKDGIYVQFYDENIEDEIIKLNFDWKKEGINIKLNKKVRIFV